MRRRYERLGNPLLLGHKQNLTDVQTGLEIPSFPAHQERLFRRLGINFVEDALSFLRVQIPSLSEGRKVRMLPFAHHRSVQGSGDVSRGLTNASLPVGKTRSLFNYHGANFTRNAPTLQGT